MMTGTPFYDIFISYCSKAVVTNSIQIQKLYKRLNDDFGFRVWLDIEQFKVENKNDKATIAKGILNSKLILSCVTKYYSQSTLNQSELELVSDAQKQVVVMMLEDLKLMDVPEISIHIGQYKRSNLYSDPRGLKNWTGKVFEDVVQKIKLALQTYEKKAAFQNKKPSVERKIPVLAASLTSSETSFDISLPKSTKTIVTKCTDQFRLKNYERVSKEIDHKGVIIHPTELASYIEAILNEYSDLSEYERQLLLDVKALNLNEQRVFYLEKFESNLCKIGLFIFKRKYNGRFQVYSCETRRYFDLSKFSQMLKQLYALDVNKHTNEFLEEMQQMSTRSVSKAFLINYLVEEMAAYYEQDVSVDWEKEFRLLPNESTIPFQRPKTQNEKMKVEQSNRVIEQEVSVVVKLPISSQTIIDRCKDLSRDLKTEAITHAVKFEKFVIEFNNMDNFTSVLLAKYPHVTDDEKRSMHKLKNLSASEGRSIFIETYNQDSAVKVTLLVAKLNSKGQFKLLTCETKTFLRILDIAEIFRYFYRLNESQQTFELFHSLEAIQSNKRINKCLVKYLLTILLRMHYNEILEIQWEQPIVENIPKAEADSKPMISEPTVFDNKTYTAAPQPQSSDTRYLNVLQENQVNLEDLKKPPVTLKLPDDGRRFVEICQNCIIELNLESHYDKLSFKKPTAIKPAFIDKYIENLLDEYFYANDYEKESLRSIKKLDVGEKNAFFIETSTHDSSKFIIFLCARQSSGRYQVCTCEDLKFHDLTEFKPIFLNFYKCESNQRYILDEFFDRLREYANKMNSKIFIIKFLIEKLNEYFNEELAVEWGPLQIY